MITNIEAASPQRCGEEGVVTVDGSMLNWRDRLRQRIALRTPPGVRHETEVEQRLRCVLDTPVPSDDELVAMQRCGELPSDAELVLDWR
jgi:hypothetical protein